MDTKKQASKLLVAATKLSSKEVQNLLEVPPDSKLGDLSFPCFNLSKKFKKDTKTIARDIASKLKPTGYIKEIKVVGSYINFFFDKEKIANKVVKEIFQVKKIKKKKEIINLDMYGPNMMKGLHLGHLRNACVSGCLYRILKLAGYTVKTNSFGSDVGLPIAKVVWGYMNLGLKPEGDKGEWLGKVYALAHESFSKSLKIKDEIYAINKKIYEGDEAVMRAYNLLNSWSYDYVTKMADRLRLKIDKYTNESITVKPAYEAIKILKKKKIPKMSDGALIVDLKKHGLGVYVLLTKQEVPTYEAKDLGLALLKKKLFKADKYVVFTGSEQVMHFKQIIKTLELMGFKKGSVIHKPYELVLKDGKKLSSRAGTTLMISSLLNELISDALDEITKKNPKLSKEKKSKIAEEVAMSSLFYGMVKQDMNKTIDFRLKDWVRFDGDTGAYLQYSYVRANKILKGQKIKNIKIKITHDAEYELVKKLNEFDIVLGQAVKKLDPSLLVRYAFDLASLFSKFYEKCPVVWAGVNHSRLLIVSAFEKRMKIVMKLLGFKPLKEM